MSDPVLAVVAGIAPFVAMGLATALQSASGLLRVRWVGRGAAPRMTVRAVVTMVLVVLVEEVLFRYLALGALRRAGVPVDVAVVLTTLPFALVHFIGRLDRHAALQALSALPSGMILGYLYWASESLLVVTAFHVMWNVGVGLFGYRPGDASGSKIMLPFSWGYDPEDVNDRPGAPTLRVVLDVLPMLVILVWARTLV